MTGYWLFKSEPGHFSWDDQVAKEEKGEEWNGVRNALAQKHMRAMKVDDLGFFYHSQTEKAVVGVVKVVAESHVDSTDPTGRWHCVDVAALAPFPRPVTLAEIRKDPRLHNMVLVKNSRLSVQPVTAEEWEIVCAMGGFAKQKLRLRQC